MKIGGLDGFLADGMKLSYQGEACPLIKDRRIRCKEHTSYEGTVTDEWTTWRTPVGIAERNYWARGPGLERKGTDWRLVPQKEIEEAQARFVRASRELAAARLALEMVAQPSEGQAGDRCSR